MATRKGKDQKTKKVEVKESSIQGEDWPTSVLKPRDQVPLPSRKMQTRTGKPLVTPAPSSRGAGEDGAGARRKTGLQKDADILRMREMTRTTETQRELSTEVDSQTEPPRSIQYVVAEEGLSSSTDSEGKGEKRNLFVEFEGQLEEMEGEERRIIERNTAGGEEAYVFQGKQEISTTFIQALNYLTDQVSTMNQRIENGFKAMDTNFIQFKEEIKDIKYNMKKCSTAVEKVTLKVQKVEDDVKECRDEMVDCKETVGKMENSFTGWELQRNELLQKIDALENQSRRNNVKIVGLPEDYEGTNLIDFFQEWIPKILGEDNFPYGLELDRAHRDNRRKPYPGQAPRSVLIRCLRYQDKEKVLKLAVQNARERRAPLMINKNRVFFYADLSAATIKKRKEFNPAKAILWEKGYKFSFRHPATLKVQFRDNQSKFFVDCQQALEYANMLPNIKQDQDLFEQCQVNIPVQDLLHLTEKLQMPPRRDELAELTDEQVNRDLEEAGLR